MPVDTAIGHTPLVELTHVNPNPAVRILAKLEGNNPGGSVKDRPALAMLTQAEADRRLTRDKTILEPTSGNTGIALAMLGAARGYRVTLTLPGCVSTERRHTLEAFGAEVVVTPSCEGTDGAIRRAWAMAEAEPKRYFMPNQFANPANWQAHFQTTGPEIWQDTQGQVTAFVAGMGTTGTLMGVTRFLKERRPKLRAVGVEPVRGHAIQGLKNMTEAIVPAIYEADRLDEVITVEDEPAFTMARRLAAEEGIFAGISSGAAVVGAVRLAERLATGTIVTVICDRGDRYLSTSLFRSTCAKCPP